MTLGEAARAIESKKRIMKIKQQEKATFDYVLADLIGRSVSRIHSSQNKMPQIEEAYPNLFDSAEFAAEKKAQLSAMRFKMFAQSFNNKYNQGVAENK